MDQENAIDEIDSSHVVKILYMVSNRRDDGNKP